MDTEIDPLQFSSDPAESQVHSSHLSSGICPIKRADSNDTIKMIREIADSKLVLKKQGSGSLEPMEPIKLKPDKRLSTKRVDRTGQDASDEEEEDEEESEYQGNRFDQIEGLKHLKLHALRNRFHDYLDEDDLSCSDLEDDEFAKMAYDELTYRLDTSTLAHNNPKRIDTRVPTVPCTCATADEDEHVLLMQKQVRETEIDLQRNELAYLAKYSCNPGVHRSGYRMYRAEDYEHLNTTPEIKDLFEYITMYTPPPSSSQVDVKLKPFIPEFYPSVGDIDAFLKVIHPEIPNDSLGIKVLDEPCAFQSDPSVLDLRLRAMAKQSSATTVVVKKVENVGKNSKVIDNWIKDISDLHRSKPSPSIHYSKPMPDIDQLLQEWPPGFESLLATTKLPPPELDCDLKTYVDIVCNLLDIPIYKSRIQSLHVLATLYLAHKSFGNYAIGGGGGMKGDRIGSHEDGVDRLELE